MRSLIHHGIKGQKWGVRRYQYEDGSLTTAGKRRYYTDAVRDYVKKYNKASAASDRGDSNAEKYWKESDEAYKKTGKNRLSRAVNNIKYDPDRLKQKELAKKESGKYKKAVEDYNRKINKAVDASVNGDKNADKYWEESEKAFAKTGKNYVQRVINNFKYDPERLAKKEKYNEAIKDYNKKYNKASRASDRNDENAEAYWDEVKAAYAKTGANYVSRIINNAKYDLSKNKR